jgi:cobyric acid synthase
MSDIQEGGKRVTKSNRVMDTAYKIHAGILNERQKAKIETKLEESQFGFRKRRGVSDATIHDIPHNS